MPALIALLILMLLTGFALIYLPRIETDFKIEDAAQTNRLFQAFYISGVTFLTIGYGDIVPSSTLTRTLSLVGSRHRSRHYFPFDYIFTERLRRVGA
jgi:hypothetical protein